MRTAFPSGVWAAPADTPETQRAVLGFIALTDSSPLIIAKEKGLYAKYGLPDVEVLKQASWGTTRDNLELGSAAGGIDGAHILTPMPYLITTGKVTKNNVRVPMYILARLNTNGQCISVAKRYLDLKVGTDASALKKAFADARGPPASRPRSPSRSRAARTTCGCATGSPRAASIRTRTSRRSSSRRRRWWRT